MKRLLFLPWEYPYRPGEGSFFQQELLSLKEGFDVRLAACLNEGTRTDSPVPCPVPYEPAGRGGKLSAVLQTLLDRNFLYDARLVAFGTGGLLLKRKRLGFVFYCYVHSHRFYASLKEKLNSWEPDIIYSYWGRETAYTALLLKRAFPKAKLVTRLHGFDLFTERSGVNFLPFRRAIAEGFDRLYFISEQGRNYFQKTTGAKAEKLSLALLGCLPTTARAKPDVDRFTFVSCGRLAPEKRIELLMDAAERIQIPFCWHHVGDGATLDALKRRAEALMTRNPAADIHFHGRLDNACIRPLYERVGARLFVNVSSSEGLPVSIMEAFSMGLPAMATDVGGTRELVSSETGVLLDSDITAEELARRLEAFASIFAVDYARLSKNALSLWAARHNAIQNATAFREALTELVDA